MAEYNYTKSKLLKKKKILIRNIQNWRYRMGQLQLK